jgi:hypothetical protein
MKISKSSWHYKAVAWGYWMSWMPPQVSLCSYFQRLVLLFPLQVILAIPVFFFYSLYWVVATGILFLGGDMPTIGPLSLKDIDDNRRPISWLKIMPITIIGPAIVLLALGWLQVILYRHSVIWIDGLAVLGIALGVGLIICYHHYSDFIENETYQLFLARYRAWKEKVCPLIEIVASDSEIEEEGGEK